MLHFKDNQLWQASFLPSFLPSVLSAFQFARLPPISLHPACHRPGSTLCPGLWNETQARPRQPKVWEQNPDVDTGFHEKPWVSPACGRGAGLGPHTTHSARSQCTGSCCCVPSRQKTEVPELLLPWWSGQTHSILLFSFPRDPFLKREKRNLRLNLIRYMISISLIPSFFILFKKRKGGKGGITIAALVTWQKCYRIK